jgi:protein TonB
MKISALAFCLAVLAYSAPGAAMASDVSAAPGADSPIPSDIPPNAVFYTREDLKRFTYGDNYYPPKAKAAHADGSAVVDCQVEPDGRLSRCAVLSETPPDMGIGEATALLFLKFAKLSPEAMKAYPQGGWKKYRYIWSYEAWAKAQSD